MNAFDRYMDLPYFVKKSIDKEISFQKNTLGLPNFEICRGSIPNDCEEFSVGKSVEISSDSFKDLEFQAMLHVTDLISEEILRELGDYLRKKSDWPKTVWIQKKYLDQKTEDALKSTINIYVEFRFFFEKKKEEERE